MATYKIKRKTEEGLELIEINGLKGPPGNTGDQGNQGPPGPNGSILPGLGTSTTDTISQKGITDEINKIKYKDGNEASPDIWTEINSKITSEQARQIAQEEISNFDFIKILSTRPATGELNKIYLVTKANGNATDMFDEWIWTGTDWEFIGSKQIEIDLTEYLKLSKEDQNKLGSLLNMVSISQNAIDFSTAVVSAPCFNETSYEKIQ